MSGRLIRTLATGTKLIVYIVVSAPVGATFKVGGAADKGDVLDWQSSSTQFTVTDLSATAPLAKPTGLTATGGNGEVALQRTDPSDSSITGHQVQQDLGDWNNVSGSGASTIEHTVTGLTNDEEYMLGIRARNGNAIDSASDAVSAMPVTLLVVPTGVVWTAVLVNDNKRYDSNTVGWDKDGRFLNATLSDLDVTVGRKSIAWSQWRPPPAAQCGSGFVSRRTPCRRGRPTVTF